MAVDQLTPVLFCCAALQPLFPKPIPLDGVVMTQMQDLALTLVEWSCNWTQPIDLVCPHSSANPFCCQADQQSCLSIISEFTEGALNALIHVIDKNIKQNWTQDRALENTILIAGKLLKEAC